MSVDAALARLESAGLLRLIRSEPQSEYAFRHALIHDAAYQSLARRQRRALHRATAEILEELLADRLDEGAATLAYHFSRADEPARAVDYQLRAADRAAAAFANTEAIALYRAALDGAAAVSLDRHRVASAHESLGRVLELVGQLDDAIAAYGRALDLTDPARVLSQARLLRRQANVHRVAHRVPEARVVFESSTRLLDGVPLEVRGDEWWSERLDLLLDRAWLHYFWGSLEEMEHVLAESAPAIDRYATDAQRTRYFARLSLLKIRRRHHIVSDEALSLTRAAYGAWQATGDPTDAELAHFQMGFAHLWRGDLDTAVPYFEESLQAAELTGDIVLQSRCLTFLAMSARMRGDADEMERIHLRAEPIIAAAGMTEYQVAIAGNRAWAAWRRGQKDAARSRATGAIELSARLPTRYGVEWTARLPLLVMALDDGDLPAAVDQARGLIDLQWADEEYADALKAAVTAYAEGDADETRKQLAKVVDSARRRGWL